MKDAIVYCEGGFQSPIGKTAHGLIRHSRRYRIVGVIDSSVAGNDAGTVLDGQSRGIPIFSDVEAAIRGAMSAPEIMVIGLAPTGFNRERAVVAAAEDALRCGLSIHSGLHLFLSDIPRIRRMASASGLEVIDVRKPPARRLRMLSGRILDLRVPRLFITGQDAAIGKRTAAIRLLAALEEHDVKACFIGTGQTSWLQGFEYGVRLDALPLDFAGGEVEEEIIRAYEAEKPDIFLIEGQGSLLNPGYSCETMILLTACLPSMLVYVYAPDRSCYVDFPDFPIRDAEEEIDLLETITGAGVKGIIVHSRSQGYAGKQPLFQRAVPVAVGPDGDLEPLVISIISSL